MAIPRAKAAAPEECAPGFPENSLLGSDHHGESHLRLIVPLLTLHRRHVTDRLEESPMVEPVHPFERGELHRLRMTPRAPATDDRGLV